MGSHSGEGASQPDLGRVGLCRVGVGNKSKCKESRRSGLPDLPSLTFRTDAPAQQVFFGRQGLRPTALHPSGV